jgi:ammonium transporter Rh
MAITDIGGSMYIHLFGAICGLVISKIITKPEAFNHPSAKSNYISDLTSVIGTLFLWMYWPSFNAASTPDNSMA